MPHRDDHDAARARIDALERQLAETEARAARELAEARERAEQAERRQAAARSEPSASPSANDAGAGWDRDRYLWSARLLVALLDLPVLVRFAGWRWDLDAGGDREAAWFFAWAFVPFAALPLLYVLARWCRAPYPASAIGGSLVASSIGVVALSAGASDMVWGGLLADPPWRWLSRGAPGLLGIAIHAAAAANDSAKAVLSEDTGSD
jgi:hypothetical protein